MKGGRGRSERGREKQRWGVIRGRGYGSERGRGEESGEERDRGKKERGGEKEEEADS